MTTGFFLSQKPTENLFDAIFRGAKMYDAIHVFGPSAFIAIYNNFNFRVNIASFLGQVCVSFKLHITSVFNCICSPSKYTDER